MCQLLAEQADDPRTEADTGQAGEQGFGMLAQQLLQRRVGLDQGRLTQGPGQGFGVGSVAVSRSNAARVETATDPSRRWRTAVGRRTRSDRAQGRLVQRDEIVRRAGGSRRAAAWSSAPSRPGSGCCRRESSTCQRVCWTLKGVSQLLVSQVTDAEQRLTVEAEATGCVQHSLGQTGADRGLR